MVPGSQFPPLLGDAQGIYRVHILGNSGAGKTTTALALARVLQVPYISLDKLMWKPGWKATPREEFVSLLRTALNENADRGWVVDGDYQRKGGALAFEEATDVIWLDPPLLLYYPRLIWRTFLRLLGLAEPCSPGCPEKFLDVFFSRESIIWWSIRYHWEDRRRNQAKMDEAGLQCGKDLTKQKMRRIGGWGGELKSWLESVEVLVQERKKSR